MSTKERNLLTWYWNLLLDLTYELDREVTAGELAKYAGVARSTAYRYLRRMLVENGVIEVQSTGKNHMTVRRYEPVGRDREWRRHERMFYGGDR